MKVFPNSSQLHHFIGAGYELIPLNQYEGIGLRPGRIVPTGSLAFLVRELTTLDTRFESPPIPRSNFLVY